MITFTIGRQTERAGIDPTLSAIVAEKGVALKQARNQHTHNVSKEYADYKGNTLFYFPLNQFIITLPSRARSPSLYPNFIKRLVNQQREEPADG